MLDWFGLRFMPADAAPAPPVTPADPAARPAQSIAPAPQWTLEIRPDATAAQKAHLASFLARSKAK